MAFGDKIGKVWELSRQQKCCARWVAAEKSVSVMTTGAKLVCPGQILASMCANRVQQLGARAMTQAEQKRMKTGTDSTPGVREDEKRIHLLKRPPDDLLAKKCGMVEQSKRQI